MSPDDRNTPAGTSAVSFTRVKERIIWGAVYNIFHEEYSTDQEFFQQVDKDVAAMKEANLDHIMVFPMSQWDPETQHLKWERTDYLIKAVEEAHLHFVPLMLKEEQCSHYFPIWKFKEIDGLWNTHNLRNRSKNNRENVDFADPRIFPLVESYFKEVIARYGTSPALSFYNIWNEPHYSSEADHTVEKFRLWLAKKYGELDVLNKMWGDDYTCWDEVTPFLNENWNSSMPQIDWILFRNELNGQLLGQLKSVLRKFDTVHQVNANPVGTPWADFSNFGFYSTDNWVFTKYNDINGASYYPDGWERSNSLVRCPAWLHNLAFTTIRSASDDKDYILTEMFTNTQNGLALNGYLDEKTIANIAWTALSNDCKGIIFWKWEPFRRGRQSLGRGLTTIEGELAPRGQAVKEIGRVLSQYGEMLLRARLRKPKVAILMDMVGLLKTLEQTAEPSTTKFMYESIAGVFKSLFEENISVDLLRMDLGLNIEKLKDYKILFLPFQVVVRREIADMVKEYVRQGGTVVADARSGSVDECDFAYRKSPGAGLDELFGARRKDWTAKKGFFPVKVKMGPDSPVCRFDGKFFRDELVVEENVTVVGTFVDDDTPAIVINEYGNGKAILSAVPLGASYYDSPENRAKETIVDCAHQAGAWPEVQFISKEHHNVDLKMHSAGNEIVVYAINNDGFDKPGSIEVATGGGTAKSVVNILSDQTIGFINKDGSVTIDITIPSNQTLVLFIEV
ncbi:MAG: beta-galactosidase [Bacteroidota bacterium]